MRSHFADASLSIAAYGASNLGALSALKSTAAMAAATPSPESGKGGHTALHAAPPSVLPRENIKQAVQKMVF